MNIIVPFRISASKILSAVVLSHDLGAMESVSVLLP